MGFAGRRGTSDSQRGDEFRWHSLESFLPLVMLKRLKMAAGIVLCGCTDLYPKAHHEFGEPCLAQVATTPMCPEPLQRLQRQKAHLRPAGLQLECPSTS